VSKPTLESLKYRQNRLLTSREQPEEVRIDGASLPNLCGYDVCRRIGAVDYVRFDNELEVLVLPA
jgi:hypothetical protein